MITFFASYELNEHPGLQDTELRQSIYRSGCEHLSQVAEVVTPKEWRYHKHNQHLAAVIRREDMRLNLCILEPVRNIIEHIPFGFQLSLIKADFEPARLPACFFTSHRQGRFVVGGISFAGSRGRAEINCSPSDKKVVVSSRRFEGEQGLKWMLGFEEACLTVVKMIHASQAARRLTVAVRGGNRGQVRRFEKDLFESIGHFFPSR